MGLAPYWKDNFSGKQQVGAFLGPSTREVSNSWCKYHFLVFPSELPLDGVMWVGQNSGGPASFCALILLCVCGFQFSGIHYLRWFGLVVWGFELFLAMQNPAKLFLFLFFTSVVCRAKSASWSVSLPCQGGQALHGDLISEGKWETKPQKTKPPCSKPPIRLEGG